MNNFWQRTFTGAVFVGVILGCVWAGKWPFWGLLFVINVLGLWEFIGLFNKNGYSLSRWVVLLLGISIFMLISFFFLGIMSAAWFYLAPIFFILFIIELFRAKDNPFINIALSVTAIIYIPVPLALFVFFSYMVYGYSPYLAMSCFLLIWANDTFAYLAGRAFGKRLLFPRISPKKTWEGFFGGMIGAIGVSLILNYFYPEIGGNWLEWIGLGLIFTVFGTLGDLVESMLKRNLNIKDSGSILPGHGGILDRFDGLLFALPFAALYILILLLVKLQHFNF